MGVKKNAKIYTCIGASNHCKDEREVNDFYATDPTAIDALLEHVELTNMIMEPACGMGHLSKRLEQLGYPVLSSDLFADERGYGEKKDFFDKNQFPLEFRGNIVTNPPYKLAKEFVERGLELIGNGYKVCMFLKLTFLEGIGRKELFDQGNLQKVIVFRKRILCAKNGDFDAMKESGGSAVAYAWFVWEKGWHGQPVIEWC